MNATIPSRQQLVPDRPTPFTEGWMRALVRFFAVTYWRIDYHGRENIPTDGPAILASNHPTYADPFMVAYGTTRWVTWLALEEAFDWPVIGWMITKMSAVPVNLDKASSSSVKAAYQVLRAGDLLGLFYEGERTDAGNFQINPPLTGTARIALKAKVPVVPVSLAGARRAWPKDSVIPRPWKMAITYHPPIYPEEIDPGASLKRRAQLLTDRISERVLSRLPPCGSFRHHE